MRGEIMGLFTKFDQEGPGVFSDDPSHGPFVRFFQSYASRFLKLCMMNLMFVFFNIPAILIAYVGSIYFLPLINPVFNPTQFQEYLAQYGIMSGNSNTTAQGASYQLYFLLILLSVMFVVGMLLVSVGPVQSGLCFLYRNFARDTTSMIWTDFVTAFKKNWKQSLAASLISLVLTTVIVMNIVFYNSIYQGPTAQILATVFVMVFVFFICIQMYVYPLIASVDLKLRNVYRNAILFFLGRFVPTMGIFIVNIIVLLVIPVLLLLSVTYFGFAVAIFYYLIFAFSFIHYLNTFFVWQQIDRYIAKPQEAAEQSSEAIDAKEEHTEE